MTRRRLPLLAAAALGALVALMPPRADRVLAAESLQSPEQFIGFRVGEDRKLARWDRIVAYMEHVDRLSDRVAVRRLGPTTAGNPFLLVEVGSAETLENRDYHRRLAARLYFQEGAPSSSQLDEILRSAKAVVLVTASVHGNEIGATQTALELVHYLAADDSPRVRKILDNVILLLVPSANPDGQMLVTDWYNSTLGTEYEGSPLPRLSHPYAGHDINRDMFMLTQRESQYLARVAWREWFPVIWNDQHQMGSNGPRMFVMPATDPINPNVHPVIYRWNAILGQSQAAALEAAGKHGIVHSATYTNFWQGALAWSGWWHNQIGVLTEVASARIASPVDQRLASGAGVSSENGSSRLPLVQLPAPDDVTPRTEYPRPWLGGRWTLRDIVDYELTATIALLEAAAERRESILRQVYEVNRQTAAGEGTDGVAAIAVPVDGQRDERQVNRLVSRLLLGGVRVLRATAPFDLENRRYAAGTFLVPMTQVFARYAKDLLEPQSYPETRRGAEGSVEDPYDVSAWSLGMQLGVDVVFSETRLPQDGSFAEVVDPPAATEAVSGAGNRYDFSYAGPDTALAINQLLESGARITLESPSRVSATGIAREVVERAARSAQLSVTARPESPARAGVQLLRRPRVGVYAPWGGGNSDEGWTRWVLERYGFDNASLHNADVGGVHGLDLRSRYDAIILPDQSAGEIVNGAVDDTIPPEYRGGIGEQGIQHLKAFVRAGGTLVALGVASQFAIDHMQVPVRDLKRLLRRDQHAGPGSILRIDVDTSNAFGFGMAPRARAFYMNGPIFSVADDHEGRATVVASYHQPELLASGSLIGGNHMAGRAAVVSIDMRPGRVVLFGIRPQHRAQTEVTFPLLFNALYMSAAAAPSASASQ